METASSPSIADLKTKAETISAGGNLAEALHILTLAEDLAVAMDDPLAMGLIWRGRANVYQWHYCCEDSLVATQKAVVVYQQYGTPFDIAVAQVVSVASLGVLERFDEALALAESIRPYFTNFPLGLATLASNVALIYTWTGQYEKAAAALEEARRLYSPLAQPTKVAYVLHDMGVLAQRMDQLALAQDYFTQAYPQFVAAGEIVGIIKTKSNLAKLCICQDRLQEALKYLAEVREDVASLPSTPDAGRLDLFEARVRRALNQTKQAEILLRSAFGIFQAAGWGIEAAEALIELAHVLATDDAYASLAEALTVLQQAEEHLQMLQVPLLHALVCLEQAELLFRLGRGAETAKLARLAHNVFAEAQLDLHCAQAEVLLGDCSQQTNPPEADACYRQALSVVSDVSPLLAARCWQGLGRLARQRQDMEAAEAAYEQTLHHLNSVRRSLYQHEYQATFLEDKQAIIEDVLTAFHQSPGPPVSRVFRWVERLKAQALTDLLARQPVDRRMDAGLRQLLAEREALVAGLDRYWVQFRGQSGTELGVTGQRRITAVAHDQHTRQHLTHLHRRLQILEEQISQQQDPVYVWREGREIPLETVQACLNEATAFLSYYIAADQLYALTATNQPGDVSITRLGITLTEVEQAWQQSRRRMMRPHMLLSDVKKRSSQFWQWLIDPIVHRLQAKQHLVIVPYRGLFHIPFAGLYNEKTGRFLVEQWSVQIVPSAAIWQHCQQQAPNKQRPLLVGYPGERGQPDYLEAVSQEIDALHRLWPQAQVLYGEAATRTAVLAEAPGHACVHLAGHIYYDGQDPLASGMPLADGRWLRASDLYLHYGQLQGAMVVLSGCESGRMQPRGGDVLGLTSAFLYAGAAGLVVGLWKVDDAATAVLMPHFYQNLIAGQNPAQALQIAQQTLLHTAAFASPYYWAPFYFIGDSAGPKTAD